jgi:hypothetical protein
MGFLMPTIESQVWSVGTPERSVLTTPNAMWKRSADLVLPASRILPAALDRCVETTWQFKTGNSIAVNVDPLDRMTRKHSYPLLTPAVINPYV